LIIPTGLGLIFDLDGVVVDSMPVHAIAWERYLDSLGLPSGDLAHRMHGRRNDEIVRGFLGSAADPQVVEEHGAAKERLFREIIGERLHDHLVPGIEEFLGLVKGMPVAIASNAERPNIDFVLDQSGLRGYFEHIVDGSQVTHPKPAPDVYRKAADLLNLPPSRCVVFEDSDVGVTAAKTAGCRVIGIQTHPAALESAAHQVEFSVANFRSPALLESLGRLLQEMADTDGVHA
jgi:beta-phosphoglucomutase family hydrolase